MFKDRQDAGRQLARALEKFRDTRPLVLGLPRGGVVVGAEVARALGGDLDVLLVKKLRAPGNPELAIGALSEDGQAYINPALPVSEEYLNKEIAARREDIAHQQRLYRAAKPRVSSSGRVVILVDDGLATGATMIAAIQATRLTGAQQVVVAVPVAPREVTLPQADETICLERPWDFQGVGQFYSDFTQVEDNEVLEILRQFA